MKRIRHVITGVVILILIIVAYLGYRTIEHEVLLRHAQLQSLAQSRMSQISHRISNQLIEKEIKLKSVVDFMSFDENLIDEMIAKDVDIDSIFILQQNKLVYPDQGQPLTQKKMHWIQNMTPIINDPSLLYSYAFPQEERKEMTSPQFGWFVSSEINDLNFIYWIKKDDYLIGFKISYINFIHEVINNIEFEHFPDQLLITDSDKLLYQSRPSLLKEPLEITQGLPYPLINWKIIYQQQRNHYFTFYLWGGALVALFMIAVVFLIFLFYREYSRAERLAKQKVNFVGLVSHELKTPLTNINLYAEMLREEALELEDEVKSVHYLNVIINETQRLTRLINNILSFTKEPKLNVQPVNLKQELEHITQMFSPAFESKGLMLNLISHKEIVAHIDRDRFIQIISNFLSNTEKYAAHGKQVDIILEENETNKIAYVHVRDYGDGIAPKELMNIFIPFYRINSNITEGVSGTGIGLTIAKQLAESLRAEIYVENMSPGIKFTLALPYE